MLDSIKSIYEEAKGKLEAQRESEVEAQLAKAATEIIAPKFEELDAKKQEAITAATVEAQTKINSIVAYYDTEKENFKNKVTNAIRDKVNENYKSEIENIENRLAQA